jgi:adenosylmethionine-8-amino-7-oxononanoate aminotransferase
MVVLAKALSGGLVPSGAVLMSDAVYNSVYTSFKRSIIHTSENLRSHTGFPVGQYVSSRT